MAQYHSARRVPWVWLLHAGVRIGDLGAKMGLNGIDNGWIQFDHVRIPHAHMLCR